MFDWLTKLVARNETKNSASLPGTPLKLLRTDLSSVDKTYPGLGEAILAYVVDGSEEEILLRLGGLKDVASSLRLRRDYFSTGKKGHSAERRGFFKQAAEIPPIVSYRLGRVYEAAWNGAPNATWYWPHLAADERWLEALLFEVLELGPNGYSYSHDGAPPFDAPVLARACEAGGFPASLLARLILLEEPKHSYSYFHQPAKDLANLGAYLATQTGTVLQALEHGKSVHRAHVLDILKHAQTVADDALAQRVVALAVDDSKTLRQAAEKLLLAQPDAVRTKVGGWIREKVVGGSPAERAHAVGLLSRIERDQCIGFLQERLAAESGKKVRAELEKYLGIQTVATEGGAGGAYEDGLEAPQPLAFAAEYEFPPDMEQDFVAAVVRYAQDAVVEHAKNWDRTAERYRHGKRDINPPADAKVAAAAFKSLRTAEFIKKRALPLVVTSYRNLLYRQIGEFIERHNLDLVPVIRLSVMCGAIEAPGSPRPHLAHHISDEAVEWISGVMQRRYPQLNLLDLGAAFEAAGLSAAWIESLYAGHYWGAKFNRLGLPNEAIWPFFLVHQEKLKTSLGLMASAQSQSAYYDDHLRRLAFRVLATFPKPPAAFATFLWERALGPSKTERPPAQACLGNFPSREKLIIQALGDGRKEVRSSAAEWLGDLGVKEAIPSIKKALAGEKSDEAKAAMMEALERLGEDIDQFLNRKKLLDDAKKAVGRPLPPELAWFPFDALPEVHWEKNRQVVPKEVIRWFILEAFKLKKAEPGPLQRRYFAMMRADERKALGAFILDGWLTQDTLPRYTQAEAEKEADKMAAQMKGYATKNPQYYPNFDEAQVRKQYLGHFLNQCLGSASDSRGILAVSAACCGPEIVPKCEKYIRFWYGRRMTQAKSLIQLLSWVDHPLAIQLILAIGTRFRTKALQKEAALCADRIAERKNWTREEMADRTIPSAGFTRDGTQIIDYGMRKFTAKLMEDYSIELRNSEGKVIGALPDALKSEEEAEVKELKKDFSASKKELKQVLKLQEERLYEAMCTQRRWRYDEWEIYLNAHPIVGRFCQQLVWLAFRDKEPVASFRPLPDGSLTDYDDNPVSLQPGDQVQVAHQSLLAEADAAKWKQHLKDYEITNLFPQFGKKLFQAEGPLAKATEIAEFEGYLVNSYKLRSRTGKLGYVRGSAEDGGWFYLYVKQFQGLRMQAVMEFTGNTLPEEDRTVALRKLYFIRMQDDASDSSSYSHRPLKLS